MSQNHPDSPNGHWAGTRRTGGRDPLQPFGAAAAPPPGRPVGSRGPRGPWWMLPLVALLGCALLAAWLLLRNRPVEEDAEQPAASPSTSAAPVSPGTTPSVTARPSGPDTAAGSTPPGPAASPTRPATSGSPAAPATPASSTDPAPSPLPSQQNRNRIPFTSNEDESAGTFEIVTSRWTSQGLLLTVRVSLTRGQQRIGFFALDNQSAAQYDSSPTDQSYLEGRPIVAGQTLEGTVLFEKEPGDTTVFLTGSRGRQVAALLVKG
ncbi:hypothetical protein [Luteococcus peritonei]|uniref:DUF4352 domain-containing protein n=1 Tax=Luteococcus peritonei TaxID=88874 RepID=A0ABW4S051_9ACTN